MFALASLLPLLQSAIDVVSAFKGTAAQAKTNNVVQDAIGLIGAATPLIEQFGRGTEVTPEQVRAALTGKDAALADFDAEIAHQKSLGRS